MDRRKVGILGGTFDPVHYGHLILAEQARVEAGLDQVVFMPAMVQPFKINMKTTPGVHRFEMLKCAVQGNSCFIVSEMELSASEVSYTIKTLRDCKSCFGGDAELYFIIGTDAFLEIEKWYKAEDLLKEFSFIVGTRPGYKEVELEKKIEGFREVYGAHIIKINNSEVEISSTDIKNRILNRKSIKYLLPEKVEEYIYRNNLYLE